MVNTGTDYIATTSLKQSLQATFEMNDLGFICYFVGIGVAYSSRGYLFSQQNYIANFLDHVTKKDDGDPLVLSRNS